jgi:hypothetical protein
MSNLARQHGDLSTMMRVVRDQVCEKSRRIRFKVFHVPVGFHGPVNQRIQRAAAFFQCANCLRRNDAAPFKLCWDILGFRSFQPHDANVVHVGNNRRNGSPSPFRRHCPPCFGWKIFDQVPVDPIVGLESIQKRHRKPACERFSLSSRLGLFRHDFDLATPLGRGFNLA